MYSQSAQPRKVVALISGIRDSNYQFINYFHACLKKYVDGRRMRKKFIACGIILLILGVLIIFTPRETRVQIEFLPSVMAGVLLGIAGIIILALVVFLAFWQIDYDKSLYIFMQKECYRRFFYAPLN